VVESNTFDRETGRPGGSVFAAEPVLIEETIPIRRDFLIFLLWKGELDRLNEIVSAILLQHVK